MAKNFNRRDFIKIGSVTVIGAGLPCSLSGAEAEKKEQPSKNVVWCRAVGQIREGGQTVCRFVFNDRGLCFEVRSEVDRIGGPGDYKIIRQFGHVAIPAMWIEQEWLEELVRVDKPKPYDLWLPVRDPEDQTRFCIGWQMKNFVVTSHDPINYNPMCPLQLVTNVTGVFTELVSEAV